MWTAVLLGLTAVWDFAKAVPWPVYATVAAFGLGFVSGCTGCN